MKLSKLMMIALALGFSTQALADQPELAGAPAIRLIRAAIPAFKARPELFADRAWNPNGPVTLKDMKEEAGYEAQSMNDLLDEVKKARSTPTVGYDTVVQTLFADGTFGVDVISKKADGREVYHRTAICKKVAAQGRISTYACELTSSANGDFEEEGEGIIQFKLLFDINLDNSKINALKLETLMAG